jgi:hypothetical protein
MFVFPMTPAGWRPPFFFFRPKSIYFLPPLFYLKKKKKRIEWRFCRPKYQQIVWDG